MIAEERSPYLTTAEAAEYLRYRTTSGIRMAVSRGLLRPAGTGPRGVYLFTREELDWFVARRRPGYSARCREAPTRKEICQWL